MCLPWWGYRVFKRKFGRRTGYVSLILFWMAFEYIHLNWQLSWPWLTLGNVFAGSPNWVQWYQFTGTSGGTLWVLVMNILLFEVCRNSTGSKFNIRKLIAPAALLIIPLTISFLLIPAKQPNNNSTNVVIVQPNIDPYGKFAQGAAVEQVRELLALTQNAIDSNTRLIIWPETALTGEDCFEGQLAYYPAYQPVFRFMQNHPAITLQTGIEIFKNYGPVKATNTARPFGDATGYYDDFNAAVTVKAGAPFMFYHKSKLVPGVETLPTFLTWMAPVFEQFGGTTGGYGKQDSSSIMQQPGQPYITAPIICYESIYGEYVSTYVQKGANLLTIMTNDGWWGNTPGHKQHLAYARLRAIETRRWVARSANTGTSAVIDDGGNIIETQPWDKAAILKYNIPVLTGQTFYVRYGDIISKAALVLACLFFAWNIWVMLKKMFSR
jgi:apolipoprotein N-acyltransferase